VASKTYNTPSCVFLKTVSDAVIAAKKGVKLAAAQAVIIQRNRG